jgi:multidrug resistance efflux pump
MSDISARIDALEQRLKQLKAKQQRAEARRRTVESHRERRNDLRRKILVGAVVLAKVDQGAIPRSTLLEWMDGASMKNEDRELFELAPVSDA